MSESDDPTTPDSQRGAAPDPTAADRARAAAESTDVSEYLRKGAIVLLSLLAVVAALRFYLAASNAISTWVTPEYRSLFQAAFNLAVLLLAVAGIAWQLRGMSD